jgi:hypothetical protein
MDCGWQNPEQEANNRSESVRSLASNADCMERAVLPQTSGIRGVLSRFAMISLQPTSGVLPDHSFPRIGFRCHPYGDSNCTTSPRGTCGCSCTSASLVPTRLLNLAFRGSISSPSSCHINSILRMKFAFKGSTQNGLVLFPWRPPDGKKLYYTGGSPNIIKTKKAIAICDLTTKYRAQGWARRVKPPSTTRSVPVMNEELSEARKRAASLTSAGIPRRPTR